MDNRRTSAIATSFAATFALSACGPDDDLLVAEGKHIDIHHEAHLELCEGTVAVSDRGIEFAAEQLGLDTTDFQHLRYFWLTPARLDEKRTKSTEHAAGWARRNTSYGDIGYFFHEIAHTVAYQREPSSLSFFKEGFATAFDEPVESEGEGSRPLGPDPRPDLTARDTSFSYDTAANFVAYLLSRHGPERFWQLYGSLRSGSSHGRLRRRFACRLPGLTEGARQALPTEKATASMPLLRGKDQARYSKLQSVLSSATSRAGGTLVAPKPWDELGATGTKWVYEDRKR